MIPLLTTNAISSIMSVLYDLYERPPQAMIPVPEQKIAEFIQMLRRFDIFPIFLENPAYSSPESQHPIYPLLRDIVNDIAQSLLAATEEEVLASYEALDWYGQAQVSKVRLLARDSIAVENLGVYLVTALARRPYYNQRNYLTEDYYEKSIVLEAFPKLATHQTDERLFPLCTPGFEPTESGIHYNNHVLFYHQFLRRNFTGNLNYDFLSRLTDYYQRHRQQPISVAIDHLRLVPKRWFSPIFEKDYWYGPPLNWKLIDNKYEVGLTVHGSTRSRLHNIDRTEFLWSYRNGLKTLQIEEIHGLVLLDDPDTDMVLNRYIHSQRDIASGTFIHLDGAVKIYERDSYQQRFDSKMTEADKSKYKPKLFRIDGTISDSEWVQLISFFFRGNEMVLEYLNKQ